MLFVVTRVKMSGFCHIADDADCTASCNGVIIISSTGFLRQSHLQRVCLHY